MSGVQVGRAASLSGADLTALHALFQEEWWTRGRTLPEVERMARAGLLYVARREDGALVGFARALTDGVFKALIFDIIVAAASRGLGLGDRLIRCFVEDPELADVQHLELCCRPELEPFYERIGFRPNPDGVRWMRLARR